MDLLEAFSGSGPFEHYAAGTVIIREGHPGNCMYVVMKGEVAITLKDKLLATARPGEIVGEMALINSDIRSATATAQTDCTLAAIDQASFESMLRHVPEFTRHVMGVLADRLKLAFEMIEQ